MVERIFRCRRVLSMPHPGARAASRRPAEKCGYKYINFPFLYYFFPILLEVVRKTKYNFKMHKIFTLCTGNLAAIVRHKKFAIVSLQTLFCSQATSFSFLLFSSISQIRENKNVFDVIWPVLDKKSQYGQNHLQFFPQITEPKSHKKQFSGHCSRNAFL